MALASAEEVLAQIPKPRAKRPRAKVITEVLVVCGSTKWANRKLMKKVLARHDYRNVKAVVIGTSKGADAIAASVAKELNMPVIQVHPQHHLGSQAIYYRNNFVFNFFKPTHVLVFHDNIDESYSSAMYIKLAKKKEIPCEVITGKPARTK